MTITLPAPVQPRLRPVPYEPLPGQAPARAAPAEPPRRTRPSEEGPPGGAGEFLDAHRAATRILRLALEVLDGKRAPMQLEPHFAPRPLRYWRAATGQRVTRAPVRHGRIRLCTPCPGVAEVAVTCRVDGTYRALAARLERADGRWRCTAVRLL
ncbi:Rv3235 family protein [Pseudonocardia adelaidensis]|uniref:Alanine, arginine and proline rich protein n=1 Tax=Pseudonocardia adelaidensis TaxID=648754 RepID=A0ABP9N8Q6_9PSEU